MESIGSYTAVAVQPEVIQVTRREQIRQNVDRALVLLENACRYTRSGWRWPYAPVRLVVFPEFFLQAWHGLANFEDFKSEILITIPGEETNRIAEVCAKKGIYFCGAATEYDPKWPDRFFNTAFIIGPTGDLIYKYRKFNPSLPVSMVLSPHDMYDYYIEEYGEGKSLLDIFFPVVETEIGNLGAFICMDGHFPETSRALALNGAEVLLRPTACPDPGVSEPIAMWKAENKVRANENMCYLVAPTIGCVQSDKRPKTYWPGGAQIFNYEGILLGESAFPGEGRCNGLINIEELRERRLDCGRNFLPLLRTEVWREVYKEAIYPINQYLDNSPPAAPEALTERAPLKVIEEFLERGVFSEPKDKSAIGRCLGR